MEKSHLPHSKIKPYGGMKLSIRPIDYQITINKTSDFTKDANFVRTKPNIEQVQFSQELQRQKVHEEKKVNSTTETEYGKIDGKNKKENKQFSKNDRENEKWKEPNTEKEGSAMRHKKKSKIDIII